MHRAHAVETRVNALMDSRATAPCGAAIRTEVSMAVYTVHEPPPKRYEQTRDPERFAFVRDGFSFWAFLFGPLWMLRHRMWLVLVGYIGVVRRAGGRAAALLDASAAASCGGRASCSRFWSASRRRRCAASRSAAAAGAISASSWRDDLEAAERRFFDAWVRAARAAPRRPSAVASRQLAPAARRHRPVSAAGERAR